MPSSSTHPAVGSLLPAGRLQVTGHSIRRGYSIERVFSDQEISRHGEALDARDTVRFKASRERSLRLCERWNRRFASWQ